MDNRALNLELFSLNLDLSSNKITDEGLGQLANAIGKATRITNLNLDLNGNEITDKGLQPLADALKKATNITSLNLALGYNKITDKGLQPLADALKKATRITSLNLNLNGTKATDELMWKIQKLMTEINNRKNNLTTSLQQVETSIINEQATTTLLEGVKRSAKCDCSCSIF